MFPGKVTAAPPSTTISSKLQILAEKELFENAFQGGEYLELEFYRYPVEVVDKQAVKVIAQTHTRTVEPLLLTWEHGHGRVYMFVSKMFLRKKAKEEEKYEAQKRKKQKEAEKKQQEANQQQQAPKPDDMQVDSAQPPPPPQKSSQSSNGGTAGSKKKRKVRGICLLKLMSLRSKNRQ